MKNDRAYLLHVRDAANRILEYTQAGKNDFFADRKTQDAVLRNLEVIGEAVKNLSEPLTSAHPEIPWKQIAGMRDVLIHHYFGVDLETVWTAVEVHVPPLLTKVESLINDTLGSES